MRTEMVPVTEAREKMKDVLERLVDRDVFLVRHSRPSAVMLSPERYSALLEQIEHLEAQLSVLDAQLHPEDGDDWETVKRARASERESAAAS